MLLVSFYSPGHSEEGPVLGPFQRVAVYGNLINVLLPSGEEVNLAVYHADEDWWNVVYKEWAGVSWTNFAVFPA